MTQTYKIYGEKTESAPGYFEAKHTEYRDGVKICVGTEDFSRERGNTLSRKEIVRYEVREATGRLMKNTRQNIMTDLCEVSRTYTNNKKIARQGVCVRGGRWGGHLAK